MNPSNSLDEKRLSPKKKKNSAPRGPRRVPTSQRRRRSRKYGKTPSEYDNSDENGGDHPLRGTLWTVRKLHRHRRRERIPAAWRNKLLKPCPYDLCDRTVTQYATHADKYGLIDGRYAGR